jgi:Uma2 family endonuclease
MSAKLPSSMLPELQPVVPASIQGNADQFKTEDDTPVDNVYSEKQQRLITEPLYSSWSGPGGSREFIVMANVGLFYERSKPPVVPDGLLSVDVSAPDDLWKRENRSYFTWKYGKPPEVVIEVVSNTEGEELGQKLRIYAEVNVPYYVVWDPENHLGKERLVAFRLRGGNYERLDDLWFEEVGLGLKVWRGPFEGIEEDWLRWCDKKGEVIPTGAEAKNMEWRHAEHERQRAEQQEQRAEQEKLRAEEERQRAEQEKQRAERLAAQLRALGVEPSE